MTVEFFYNQFIISITLLVRIMNENSICTNPEKAVNYYIAHYIYLNLQCSEVPIQSKT